MPSRTAHGSGHGLENLLFLGTVLSSGPIYHRNALKNVPEFKTESYEYYRTYPYRATQWWLRRLIVVT